MNDQTNVVGFSLLRQPFAANQISKLPKPYKKDSPKGQCKECGGYHGLPAMHLDYVGHAALTDRLLDVDPQWTWEPLALDAMGLPALDKDGGLWIKLTVLGVTRLGYGDAQNKTGGDAMKERIGDALRNAAMRFGCALDLWHKGILHPDEDTGEIDPPPPPPLAPYPDAQFVKNLPAWAKLIQSGKKTADEIIEIVSSKGVLSLERKDEIRAIKPKPTEGNNEDH